MVSITVGKSYRFRQFLIVWNFFGDQIQFHLDNNHNINLASFLVKLLVVDVQLEALQAATFQADWQLCVAHEQNEFSKNNSINLST